ncbi:MAG TPA: ABC transporter substrate-binding protein [Burkholderiales bacterium]|nr:ABC transporter substrate-binding protein [Burkholderiales bacterium]
MLLLGGSVAAAALASRVCSAQQANSVRRVGLLQLVPFPPLTDPLLAALKDRGWTLGKNLSVETRITAPQQERAAEMAKELIRNGCDLLIAIGTANAVAAKQATQTVPIVMLAGYPVESGLVASLAKPGGNLTGVTIYAGTGVFGKQVALAKELVPTLRELGVLWAYAPPAFPEAETEICLKEMRTAADALRIRLRVWMNRSEEGLHKCLVEVAKAPLQALFVTSGGPQSTPEGIAKVARFAEQRRLPVVCDIASTVFRAAGVLTYAANLGELGATAASFVDRILRGAKPNDLPIERPTRFELVINAQRMKAIGLTIPPTLLARADRVI